MSELNTLKEQDNIVELIKNSDARNLFYAIAKAVVNTASYYDDSIIASSACIFVKLDIDTKFNPFEIYLLHNRTTLKKLLQIIGNFSISNLALNFDASVAVICLENSLHLSKFADSPLYLCWVLFSPAPPHE